MASEAQEIDREGILAPGLAFRTRVMLLLKSDFGDVELSRFDAPPLSPGAYSAAVLKAENLTIGEAAVLSEGFILLAARVEGYFTAHFFRGHFDLQILVSGPVDEVPPEAA